MVRGGVPDSYVSCIWMEFALSVQGNRGTT